MEECSVSLTSEPLKEGAKRINKIKIPLNNIQKEGIILKKEFGSMEISLEIVPLEV